MGAGEDQRHFWRSLARGKDTWKKPVVLADAEDLICCNSELECFVANIHITDREQTSGGELVLRSSDPLLAGQGPFVTLPCWSIPRDAVWLVDTATDGDELISVDELRVQSADLPLDPRLVRFPRVLVYWSFVLVFYIVLAATLIFGHWLNDTSLTSIAYSLSYALLFWLAFCGSHLWRYSVHELRHWEPWRRLWRLDPSLWIARTTRCLADGDRVRSGHSSDRERQFA